MTRDNNKKTHYVVLGGKGGGGQAESVEWDDIQNKPEFATVATSGDYNDLNDKPTILTQWFGTQAEYDAIETKDPNVIYNIEGSDNVQADWNQTDTTADDYIKNKPTIPAAQVNSDWNANSGVAQILNKPTLATVATTGSYTSLKNKPTVPDKTETLTFTLQGGTTVTMDVYVKPDYAKTYFFVQDLSGNDSTYTIETMDGDTPSFDVYTSTDQQNWTLLGTVNMLTTLHTTVPANGKLYIKATTDRWGVDEMSYCNAPYAIGGNIMSLLYGDNFANVTAFTPGNTRIISFGNWQSENNLYDASNLVLPATTLAKDCYENMFDGCSALTTAPALPATTLTVGCYQSMFQYCTSLTEAPALPATTLAKDCYENMFAGCTNLNKVTAYATDISATYCLSNWLDSVSSTGDFYNLGGATYSSGASGIPSGWTEHTSL